VKKARLVFEDGTIFNGQAFACEGDRFGEVVFNTAMTGYQEVLTDPSYCGQMVLMTYPLIGNYGINEEDVESSSLFLSAFIVKEYLDFPSNWRSQKSLKKYLEENNILGVEGIDTRALTRFIREKGAQKALLTTSDEALDVLLKKVKTSPSMVGRNLVSNVSCKEPYIWPGSEDGKYKVAVIDCGVKYNILRLMAEHDCSIKVFPYNILASEILAEDFDGVFLSNGPGDPEPVKEVASLIKEILGKLPIFGICLGHQLLGIALGAKTYKLKFGHHGVNHPVKYLKNQEVEITSQNHGFCVDIDSIDGDIVETTHMNLNDNTMEGFRHKKYPAFAVQYHPEAGPGPHDSRYLFEEFVDMMERFKGKK
jgi:carbamoyl-phosphate synthase small subunit